MMCLQKITVIIIASLIILVSPLLLYAEQKDRKSESTYPDKELKVAVVTSNSRFGDIKANLKHFETIIKKATQKGARLVCFPEMAVTGYAIHPDIFKVAVKIPGPLTNRLTRLAAKYNVYISAGTAEKDNDKYYITQVVVGPNGYLGKYRKHHPVPGESEAGFSDGKTFPTFDIDGFKMGINICADGRLVDTIEPMKKANVDFIHHPHGNYLGNGNNADEWTKGKLVYLALRAIYTRSYILVNNSAGNTSSPNGNIGSFGSGAMVIDPLGQAITRTTQKNRKEQIIYATLVKPIKLIPQNEIKWLNEPTITLRNSDKLMKMARKAKIPESVEE